MFGSLGFAVLRGRCSVVCGFEQDWKIFFDKKVVFFEPPKISREQMRITDEAALFFHILECLYC